MSLEMTISNAGLATSAVIAGLYILSLFLTSLTTQPAKRERR